MADSRRPRRRSLRRLRTALFGVNALVLTGVVLAAYGIGVLDQPERDTLDTRFEVRGSGGAPSDVVVVAIDDVTFDELDLQWPFLRSLHGRAIDRLRRDGAKVIAYDIQFTEQTKPREDNALIESVDRTDGVVLATTEVDKGGRTAVFGGDRVLRAIGAKPGSSNFDNDDDGVIRRMPYEVEGLKSFARVAADEFRGGEAPAAKEGSEYIDYAGRPGTVDTVSFSRLVEGRSPAGDLQGQDRGRRGHRVVPAGCPRHPGR